MYSSDHDRLASIITKSASTGCPESIFVYDRRVRWEISCEWNGGVPFLTCTHPDGTVSNISSHHALGILENASPFTVERAS